jgi:hypothetical protein
VLLKEEETLPKPKQVSLATTPETLLSLPNSFSHSLAQQVAQS